MNRRWGKCTRVAGVDGLLDRGGVDGEVVRLGAVGGVRDHTLVGLGRRGPAVVAGACQPEEMRSLSVSAPPLPAWAQRRHGRGSLLTRRATTRRRIGPTGPCGRPASCSAAAVPLVVFQAVLNHRVPRVD